MLHASFEVTMDVDEAIATRRSVRAFEQRDVPEDILARIFASAQRAPSWCNIQPWRVWVASGERRMALTDALVNAASTRMPEPDVAFPANYKEPYGALRRACGKALYSAMNIARDDGPGRQRAWMRNFVAFDAPHVAIVGVDRDFGLYGALDVGCWLQTLMLAATAEGVATCAQAALATYPDVARAIFSIPPEIQILFGVGLGFEDVTAAANSCRTDRDPIDKNIVFVR